MVFQTCLTIPICLYLFECISYVTIHITTITQFDIDDRGKVYRPVCIWMCLHHRSTHLGLPFESVDVVDFNYLCSNLVYCVSNLVNYKNYRFHKILDKCYFYIIHVTHNWSLHSSPVYLHYFKVCIAICL